MRVTPAPPSFGQIHFSGLNLGDARVNARIVDLADTLLAAEADAWPAKFADPAQYRAFQRLVNRPQATHDAVRATHTRHTRDRMARSSSVVLVIHDTTELDFTGRSTLGLGPIGNGGGRGWECHNTVAVEPATGAVLGRANQILHRRVHPGVTAGEGVAAERGRESRESRLWWDGVQAVGVAPPGGAWVHVCDRGADHFEFLQAMSTSGQWFVVRSKVNRRVRVSGPEALRLHEHVRSLPAQAGWHGVARTGTGRDRPVKLQGCWAAVRLLAPRVRRGQHDGQPVPVTVIRV